MVEFASMFQIYRWVILAGVLMGLLLTVLGNHLATRDRGMQTVCISQGALLGVLLALGGFGALIDQANHDDPTEHLLPLIFALLGAGIIYVFTEWLSLIRVASRNSMFAAVFAILMACSYFVSAVFPGLESHLGQVFFGDLATLNEWDAGFSCVFGFVGLMVLWKFHSRWSRDSFEIATFGETISSFGEKGSRLLFYLVTVLTLCFSVLFLGFLFTIGCLFIPTVLMGLTGRVGLGIHFIRCLQLSFVSIIVGFVLTLWQTNWPTVPVILLCQFLLATLSVVFIRIARI